MNITTLEQKSLVLYCPFSGKEVQEEMAETCIVGAWFIDEEDFDPDEDGFLHGSDEMEKKWKKKLSGSKCTTAKKFKSTVDSFIRALKTDSDICIKVDVYYCCEQTYWFIFSDEMN